MSSGQAKMLPQSHLHIYERHIVDGGKALHCDRPAGLHVSSEITDLGACTRAGFIGIRAASVSEMVMEMFWRVASQQAALCGRTSCMGSLIDLHVGFQVCRAGVLQALTQQLLTWLPLAEGDTCIVQVSYRLSTAGVI